MELLGFLWAVLSSEALWFAVRDFVSGFSESQASGPVLAAGGALIAATGVLWAGIFAFQGIQRARFSAFDESDVRRPVVSSSVKGTLGLIVVMAAAVAAASVFYGDLVPAKPAPDQPAATPEPAAAPEPAVVAEAVPEPVPNLRFTIYFAYAAADLTEEAKGVLRQSHGAAVAACERGALSLRMEGHTDERHTREESFRIGDERARAAKGFLVEELGMDPDAIVTMSYGKVRPAAIAPTEEDWARNRRVEGVYRCNL